jgi:hypothetical protein
MYILSEYSISGQTLHQPPWFCSSVGSVSNTEAPPHNASRIWTDCGGLWLQCSLKVCLYPQYFARHSKCSDNILLLILLSIVYMWLARHMAFRTGMRDATKSENLKERDHFLDLGTCKMNFKKTLCKVMNWLHLGQGQVLRMWWWTFRFRKMQRISWVIKQLSPSQEGLYSMAFECGLSLILCFYFLWEIRLHIYQYVVFL